MKIAEWNDMMAYLTRRQRFSIGGDATILPKPNPLSETERNQKVFDDYVGRMKKYLGAGVGMPEWFVKDLIFKKADELGIELKADGGRIGFAEGPPGTIKKETGPTKYNTGNTSPVKTDTHIYKRTNRWGTVWSDTPSKTAEGWKTRKKTPDHVIRERLIENGIRVKQHNGKFIFADITEQAAFDDALDKRYKHGKASNIGKQAGVLNNAQIYEQFLKGHYSEKGIHDLIFRHKQANDLEYKALSDDQKVGHKVERDNLIRKYQKTRFSGTIGHPAHHLYSLSDPFDVKSKNLVIIPREVNERMAPANKKLLDITKSQVLLMDEWNQNNFKEMTSKLKAIDSQAAKVINEHYKNFPEDKGLLKYRKINAVPGSDGSIGFARGDSIGGDSSKWITKDMGKNINKLDANEKRIYRQFLLNKAKEMDLKVADESKSSSTKSQIFARKILDKGQNVWKMLPGKNFKIMPSGALAATDFAISTLLGVPPEIAGLSASGWLTGKGELGKAISAQTQSASFMDEINEKKAEDNLAASERLKTLQKTAEGIGPFELDEKEEVVTANKPTYGPYAEQIKNLKV